MYPFSYMVGSDGAKSINPSSSLDEVLQGLNLSMSCLISTSIIINIWMIFIYIYSFWDIQEM